MTGAILVGLLAGTGVLLVATGLAPAPPPLARELANLRQRPFTASAGLDSQQRSPLERLGRLVANVGTAQRMSQTLASDLRVTDTTVAGHLGAVMVATGAGLFGPAFLAAVLWTVGLDVGVVRPLWAGLVTAALGFLYPGVRLRSKAAERRRSFRHSLSAFLDVVAISLAGGRGVDTALRDGAEAGHEWSFLMIQTALFEARLAGDPPWAGLARLGAGIAVPELEELAASAALAGSEGAPVRASLAAKGRAMRHRGLTEVEAAANSASETMSLPVVLLMVGFVIFLGFPAVIRVLQGI